MNTYHRVDRAEQEHYRSYKHVAKTDRGTPVVKAPTHCFIERCDRRVVGHFKGQGTCSVHAGLFNQQVVLHDMTPGSDEEDEFA